MTWYTGDPTYDTVLTAALAFVAIVAVAAWFVASPYGRFSSGRFGLRLNPRLGWFLMELPATVVFLWAFLGGPRRFEPVPLLLAAIFVLHYANRGFAFPLRMRVPRGHRASFGLLVVGTGWFVTSAHGYLNGAFFSTFGAHYTPEWLTDPRFLAGLVVYYVSYALNLQSDAILRNLRSPEEVEAGVHVYRVPKGGLYRWITSPSYLTELTAWAGFALLTWSLAGVFILAISAANLVPRAVATQRWYRERFPDYPPERKALIPFLF
jgi:3-oxo-5-alpha-steroid 4-dehydrogenase 1